LKFHEPKLLEIKLGHSDSYDISCRL